MNENNEIVSIVIGYTNNYKDKIAYISVVATLPKYCGRGYALKNMNRFIQLCKDKKMKYIHLYTTNKNYKAIKLYKYLGFQKFVQKEEARQNDVHLILEL